jgi:hypothetical protein
MKTVKKYTLLLIIIVAVVFVSCKTTEQNVTPSTSGEYQAGVVMFKLKDDYPLNFSVKEDKNIDLKEFKFLRKEIKKFEIVQITRPFDLFDDPKLLRTFKIAFKKEKNIDALIDALNAIPEIEYAEKIPIKRKLK